MENRVLKEKFSQKSILFVNYYFPPIGAIGSIRNVNVANLSTKYFKKVFVHSTSNKHLYPKNKVEVSEKISTTYLPTLDYQTVKFLVRKIKSVYKKNKKGETNGNSGSSLAKKLNDFPYNLLVGEGGFVYILFNVLVILLKIRKIDYIYSSYSPHSDHFVAYFIKRMFPKISWIADFRDIPLTDLDGNKPKGWKNKFNNRIIKRADVVLTVSYGLAERIQALNSNVLVLRNGISDFLLDRKQNEQSNINLDKDKFNISYTGALYQGKRDPSILFEVLKSMIDKGVIDQEKLSINYAGREGSVWDKLINQYGLQQSNNNLGLVAYEDAVYLQQSSQLNLLLSWASKNLKGVLTGKFYEYLAARNPVLLILKGEMDEEFESIFKDLDAGVVVNPDVNESIHEELTAFLFDKYNDWQNSATKKIEISKLKNYTWDTVFVDVFSKL